MRRLMFHEGANIMGDNNLMLVAVAAAFVLIWMLIRSRRTAKATGVSRRHWEEHLRDQEEAGGPSEPEWHLKELDAGGMFHLSLPRGLEEDYRVLRRDRIERPDEQIEYALQVESGDPEHPMWLNWHKQGIHTHAWLVEYVESGPAVLGLSSESLGAMRESGVGTATYRDREYTLDSTDILVLYPSGKRPGKDMTRWDLRDETGTRQLLVHLKEWEEEAYQVYAGHELWLRDLTIVAPRGGAPAPDAAQPADTEEIPDERDAQ